MIVVNLKTAITFRLELDTRPVDNRAVAFTTKTFRAVKAPDRIPEPKDQVSFDVTAIVLDSSSPWYTIDKPIRCAILWSNVLSVQYEEAL